MVDGWLKGCNYIMIPWTGGSPWTALMMGGRCFEASRVNISKDRLMVCVVGSRWIMEFYSRKLHREF